jgi:hypothetical protein
MESNRIVLVLRSGGDFHFQDVELICQHINGQWKNGKPEIILLYDKATKEYDLGNLKIIPLINTLPGTWSRIMLYSPEMEKYRPFLYLDLDTAIIQSVENLINIIPDKSLFITLEDFYQRGLLATGLVWFPAKSKKVENVWKAFKAPTGTRMDVFLRRVVTPDKFWQDLTNSIADFKPKSKVWLSSLENHINIVCFHGKPRIKQAISIPWVRQYIHSSEFKGIQIINEELINQEI